MGVADVAYGREEVSRAPRLTWIAVHLAELAIAGIVLAVGSGDPARRVLLFAFGLVLWVRMTYTAASLLKRRLTWTEAGGIAFGTGVYQIGFAVFGAGSAAPLGAWDALALLLFLGGGAMNTFSEIGRRRFKSRPENRGRLYTGGLFALSRHPNYLGDVLWGAGWALATRNGWAWLLVALEISGFVFLNVPALDRYLASRYGAEYEEWAARTKRLVPFVY